MAAYGTIAVLSIALMVLFPIVHYMYASSLRDLFAQVSISIVNVKRESETSKFKVDILESTITWASSNKLTFYVRNVGSKSIAITNVKYAETFILYYLKSSGSLYFARVPYNASGSAATDFYWRIEGVRTMGGKAEFLNVIYPAPAPGIDPKSGLWDPGEELLIAIYFKLDLLPDTTKSVSITLVLHNGVSDSAIR